MYCLYISLLQTDANHYSGFSLFSIKVKILFGLQIEVVLSQLSKSRVPASKVMRRVWPCAMYVHCYFVPLLFIIQHIPDALHRGCVGEQDNLLSSITPCFPDSVGKVMTLETGSWVQFISNHLLSLKPWMIPLSLFNSSKPLSSSVKGLIKSN